MRDVKPLDTNGEVFLDDLTALLENLGRHHVLFGLTVANNTTDPTNDLDLTQGLARSTNGNQDKILELTATHVKQLDVAFAEYVSIGTPSGGRDPNDNLTGAKWFNVFLIGGAGKNDQGFFSTSDTPTLPAGFTDSAYVTRNYWTGSAIKPFTMGVGGDLDRVQWATGVLDVNANNPGTTRQTPTLTAPPDSLAHVRISLVSAATTAALMAAGHPSEQDAAPSKTAAPLPIAEVAAGEDQFVPASIPVDGSSQLFYRLDASDANITVRIETVGFTDLKRRR